MAEHKRIQATLVAMGALVACVSAVPRDDHGQDRPVAVYVEHSGEAAAAED